MWTSSGTHFSRPYTSPGFHTISKSQKKFQSGDKIVSMVLKLVRALVISALGCKVAVQRDLSSSFPRLGMTTTLTTSDLLVSVKSCRVGNTTSPLQTTNGSAFSTKQEVANQDKIAGLCGPFKKKNNSSSLFSTRAVSRSLVSSPLFGLFLFC